MKVVGYFGHSSELHSELKRACRTLGLLCEIASSERGVLKFIEMTDIGAAQNGQAGGQNSESFTVVTTDDHIPLLRELRARAPEIRLLILSRKSFFELPHFVALNQSIDGYYVSPELHCGAEFFVSFFRRQVAHAPAAVTELLGKKCNSIRLTLNDVGQKQSLLDEASKYYRSCLGDSNDPGDTERVRHLQDSLDELLSNVIQHGLGLGRGTSVRTHGLSVHKQKEAAVLAEVELSFDGSMIATCVRDPFGALDKATVLKSLSKDFNAIQRLPGAELPSGGLGLKMVMENHQHLIFNLCAEKSTEIIGIFRVTSRFIDAAAQPSAFEIRTWKKAS